MRLEQSLYEPMQESKENLRVYQIGDLESLSATELYTGEPCDRGMIKISSMKIGETLPGGLKIKDLTSNTVVLQQNFKGVGNIYDFHPDGHGSLKSYGNDIVNGIKQGKKREKKIRSW